MFFQVCSCLRWRAHSRLVSLFSALRVSHVTGSGEAVLLSVTWCFECKTQGSGPARICSCPVMLHAVMCWYSTWHMLVSFPLYCSCFPFLFLSLHISLSLYLPLTLPLTGEAMWEECSVITFKHETGKTWKNFDLHHLSPQRLRFVRLGLKVFWLQPVLVQFLRELPY